MTDKRACVSDAIRAAREGSVGWLIQRLAGQLDRAMDEKLAPHGLTIQKFAVVMTVMEHDGLTQSEIGNRFRSPAYKITRSIDALEADGFLERRAHPASRRTNTVHATAKALQLAPTLIAIIEAVNRQMLAGLGSGEDRQVHALLRQMLERNDLSEVDPA
jgi:MarR family transcriptional regulator for hemolysin